MRPGGVPCHTGNGGALFLILGDMIRWFYLINLHMQAVGRSKWFRLYSPFSIFSSCIWVLLELKCCWSTYEYILFSHSFYRSQISSRPASASILDQQPRPPFDPPSPSSTPFNYKQNGCKSIVKLQANNLPQGERCSRCHWRGWCYKWEDPSHHVDWLCLRNRLCVGGSGRSSIDCVAVGVRVLDDVYLDKLYMEVSGRRLGRKGRNGRKGRREEIFLKYWSLGNLYSIDKRGRRMK